jgi:hypothetical protein
MGKLYDDYIDHKRIQEDQRREESKRRGVIACKLCGGPTPYPRGISGVGGFLCGRCQRERMRVRG